MRRAPTHLFFLPWLTLSTWAHGAGPLPEVLVRAQSLDASSEGRVSADDIAERAWLRPADVLESVPGLVVTQHSGDGKANQYFLRGFNLDHGTDFATQVQGVPVNMPTHAHGQGYSDLNFLIPELIERINYRKGPYAAQAGDFAAAGSASIRYRTQLPAPMADVSLGQRGYARGLLANSWSLPNDAHALLALEATHNDGPWTTPEGLRKRNAVMSWSQGNQSQGWAIHLMSYQAQWRATDQVPARLIDAGNYMGAAFDRFDSLDASSGGHTQRHSLSAQWHHTQGAVRDEVSVYLMRYDLRLFSNFTYALQRPLTGDQFAQIDGRDVMGLNAQRSMAGQWMGDAQRPTLTTVGVQVRGDDIALGLYDAALQRIIATVREDRVSQTQVGVFASHKVAWSPWLTTVAGWRLDRMGAQVRSLSNPLNSGSTDSALASPKLTVVFGPWRQTEFFANAGYGFHSNDARGTVARVDPRDGTPLSNVPALSRALGRELGLRSMLTPHWQTVLTLWQLDADSELLYKADQGTTEAGRPSRRVGVEWGNHWQLSPTLALHADLAWTQARYSDGASDDRVPNAVEQVGQASLIWRGQGPWGATLQWRYIGPAALTSDGSLQSEPAQVFNLRATYQAHARTLLYADVFNLTNARVYDIQYAYASRLPTDPINAAINGLHVHPAEPLTLRIGARLMF